MLGIWPMKCASIIGTLSWTEAISYKTSNWDIIQDVLLRNQVIFLLLHVVTEYGDIELLCPRNETYIRFSVANYLNSFGGSKIESQNY